MDEAVPEGFDFFGPESITDTGRVYGTPLACGPEACSTSVGVYRRGFTLLDPLPTEPDSWGQAINHRGHVLGYAVVAGGLERIGVWRGTELHTYFVQGTDEFPTVSNRLLWNERSLIVITDTTDENSYLVPRPGVRLTQTPRDDRAGVGPTVRRAPGSACLRNAGAGDRRLDDQPGVRDKPRGLAWRMIRAWARRPRKRLVRA